MAKSICSVDGCSSTNRVVRGLCSVHYFRWRRATNQQQSFAPAGLRRGSLAERFHARYDVADNGCWIWRPPLARNGYGMLAGEDGYHPRSAHRIAYELLVGPIPDGLDLDHLCRTPSCVNPDHLEPVTHQENLRRFHEWRRANESSNH